MTILPSLYKVINSTHHDRIEPQMKEQMLVIQKSFISNNLFSSSSSSSSSSSLLLKKNGRSKFGGITYSQKRDIPDGNNINSSPKQEEPKFTLKVTDKVLARSLIALFGLGFVDAGYSGDWSRIGIIAKESEDLLKVAAFVVVPLCLVFIFSISKDQKV